VVTFAVEVGYLSNYSLKYIQMKASFKVVQFKCPSYNALNGHNVEHLKKFLGSHTSNGGEFCLAHFRLPTHQIL